MASVVKDSWRKWNYLILFGWRLIILAKVSHQSEGGQ